MLIKNNILQQLNNTASCTECEDNNILDKHNIVINTFSIINLYIGDNCDSKDAINYTCGICNCDLNGSKYFNNMTNAIIHIRQCYEKKNCPNCKAILIMPDKYYDDNKVEYYDISDN